MRKRKFRQEFDKSLEELLKASVPTGPKHKDENEMLLSSTDAKNLFS